MNSRLFAKNQLILIHACHICGKSDSARAEHQKKRNVMVLLEEIAGSYHFFGEQTRISSKRPLSRLGLKTFHCSEFNQIVIPPMSQCSQKATLKRFLSNAWRGDIIGF